MDETDRIKSESYRQEIYQITSIKKEWKKSALLEMRSTDKDWAKFGLSSWLENMIKA